MFTSCLLYCLFLMACFGWFYWLTLLVCFCYSTKRIYRSVTLTLFCIFHSTERFSHKLPGRLDLENLSLSANLSRPDPTESKSVPPNEVGDGCLHSSVTVLTIAWCRTPHEHKVSQPAHTVIMGRYHWKWIMNTDPFPLQVVLNQQANRGLRLPQVVWTSFWTPL